MVPVEFLTVVLPHLTRQPVEYQEGTNRIFLGDVRPASFTARLDPIDNGARLTVQFTDKVAVRTTSSNGKWVMFLDGRPMEPMESSYRFQNPYVSELQYDDQDGVPKLVLSPTENGLNFYPVQAEGGKILLADVVKPPTSAAQGAPGPTAAPSAPTAGQPAAAGQAPPPTEESPATPPGLPLPVIALDAGHGGNDDRDLVAGIDLALDAGGDVADAVEVGHRGTAEFHDDAGHGWIPKVCPSEGRAHILAVEGAGNMQPDVRAGVSPDEIARFDALASRWWDPAGPMRPLHRMNPLRIGWIDTRVRRQFGGPVRLLDAGCGAGLAAEALARRGHDVLGIDAAGEALAAARAHAEGKGLKLAYRDAVAANLRGEGSRFPVITALEVIEHVPDPAAFIADLAQLLEPGGLLFLSTINRTKRSFLAAKVGAEYLLRWLPVGTHDWRKFIPPAELGRLLRRNGLALLDIAGMRPDPFRGGWRKSSDLSVNYIVEARG
jgi:2-polyprenyl-6-hydroxyphenyl methylase/3-demethylubiquinone-9 3-methyltransferase